MQASSAPRTLNTNATRIDDRNDARSPTNVTSVRFWILASLVLAIFAIYMVPTGHFLLSNVTSRSATHEPSAPSTVEEFRRELNCGYSGLMFLESEFHYRTGPPEVLVDVYAPRKSMVFDVEPGFSANYGWVESIDLHSFRFKCKHVWSSHSPRSCSFNVTGYWHSYYRPLSGKVYPPTTQVASQVISYHPHGGNVLQEMVNVTLSSDFKRVKRIDFELLTDQRAGEKDTLLVLEELVHTVHPKEGVSFRGQQ